MIDELPELVSCTPAFVNGFTRTLYDAGYSEKQAAQAHHAVVVAELRQTHAVMVDTAFRHLKQAARQLGG